MSKKSKVETLDPRRIELHTLTELPNLLAARMLNALPMFTIPRTLVDEARVEAAKMLMLLPSRQKLLNEREEPSPVKSHTLMAEPNLPVLRIDRLLPI
jgi:hypothetical protein